MLTDAYIIVDPEDESDYEQDLLVQFLFDEIKDLRVKVSLGRGNALSFETR